MADIDSEISYTTIDKKKILEHIEKVLNKYKEEPSNFSYNPFKGAIYMDVDGKKI